MVKTMGDGQKYVKMSYAAVPSSWSAKIPPRDSTPSALAEKDVLYSMRFKHIVQREGF